MESEDDELSIKFFFDERDAVAALQDMNLVIEVVQSITGFGVAEDHV